uniref:invasin domain 3-containing protein n=1 Tax=Escherichia coli TaxID=562 RepID=UPI000AAE526B
DMKVTVTLKDLNGNVVTGQKAALTTTSVTVPNATLKAGSDWTDNDDGTYTATYTAAAVSTGNQASLKLSGWSDSRTSEKYVITAGSAVQATSGIKTDAATYVAGADMKVTVTLKDLNGNVVTGQKAALTTT